MNELSGVRESYKRAFMELVVQALAEVNNQGLEASNATRLLTQSVRVSSSPQGNTGEVAELNGAEELEHLSLTTPKPADLIAWMSIRHPSR